jgi:DNA polymerase III, alpha subunit (gram-positive type)
MENQFFDIMVDIETTGLDINHSAMIQLAAVRFNLAERTVDTTSMFNKALLIPPGRFWDEGTREWWGRQKREVLSDIYSRMQDPKTVMEEFADWVGYCPAEPIRFWAKPISFDFPFVASYFNQFNIPNPFHYRWATDVNSFIRGIAQDASVETYRIEFQGDAHNALVDCVNQIKCVFEAVDHYRCGNS